MDELVIAGKVYISSRRAAKENKYHADYIGQLIRGGKVLGTKVGRAWYVERDSLAAYLGQEPTPFVPKKLVPVVEEKKEVSETAPLERPRRTGLVYVSDTPEIQTFGLAHPRGAMERGGDTEFSAIYPKHPDISPVQEKDDSALVSLPHRSTSRALLRVLGRVFLVLAVCAAFATSFGGSYLLSYQSSIVGGSETTTVSFDR